MSIILPLLYCHTSFASESLGSAAGLTHDDILRKNVMHGIWRQIEEEDDDDMGDKKIDRKLGEPEKILWVNIFAPLSLKISFYVFHGYCHLFLGKKYSCCIRMRRGEKRMMISEEENLWLKKGRKEKLKVIMSDPQEHEKRGKRKDGSETFRRGLWKICCWSISWGYEEIKKNLVNKRSEKKKRDEEKSSFSKKRSFPLRIKSWRSAKKLYSFCR